MRRERQKISFERFSMQVIENFEALSIIVQLCVYKALSVPNLQELEMESSHSILLHNCFAFLTPGVISRLLEHPDKGHMSLFE